MKYTFLTLLWLSTGICQAVIKPADGLWTTEDDPAIGSGLMMTSQNGITLVSVFTYDVAGQNVWYIASGQIDEAGVLEAELRKAENGQNLLLDSPQAASFVAETRSLRLEFTGSQVGSMSIDGAENKQIEPQHFGFATTYRFPDITGKWVFVSVDTEMSFILDIEELGFLGGIRPPVWVNNYRSLHPSTSDWGIGCTVSLAEQWCSFQSGDFEETVIRVDESDIGNQSMVLSNFDGSIEYQAFRLDKDRRLLPNDGHWRPADDPAIGSGVVMRTQGDYTLVLLYSYDDEGMSQWQIASGQFDEAGQFSADLLTPMNGSAIEGSEPTSASFAESTQTIEIQLQGLELATFSIDGSEPKFIQNYNFGVDLFDTENFLIDDYSYLFPNQVGQWAFTYYAAGELKAGILELIDGFPIFSPTPPGAPPYYYASLDHLFDGGSFMNLVCPGIILQGYASNCYGNTKFDNDVFDIKVNYQDIGFNHFRMRSVSSTVVSDDLNLLEFFRLAE